MVASGGQSSGRACAFALLRTANRSSSRAARSEFDRDCSYAATSREEGNVLLRQRHRVAATSGDELSDPNDPHWMIDTDLFPGVFRRMIWPSRYGRTRSRSISMRIRHRPGCGGRGEALSFRFLLFHLMMGQS
jgi:hypothetical protein